MFLDTIRLAFGNSLIIGNAPEALPLNEIVKRHGPKMDLESFGLFDNAANNFSHYYPEVTAEDLKPKEGDYIYPIFRALSEVIVHKDWNPIDFSMNGVLKKSTKLLQGQTVYPNHDASVGNELGAVKKTMWEESYKQDGIVIPAGINSELMIDGKSNPKIARAIMSDPPSIHSSSVTVEFLWVKSHPELADDKFFQSLGSYDKDGHMVRRLVEKVRRYKEISMVTHGADPFAQKKVEGGINDPNFANISYNGEQRKKQTSFFFDFKQDLVSNAEDEKRTILDISNEENNSNKNKPDMNFLQQLAATLGINTAGLTDEQLQEKVTTALAAAVAAQTSLADNQTQLTTAQAEVTRLTNELAEAKKGTPDAVEFAALKTFKETQLSAKRAKVTAIYLKTIDNKPNDAITNMITNADLTALEGLEVTYQTQLESKFPASCKDCGSTNVNRASASEQEQQEGFTEKDGQTTVDALLAKKKSSGLKLPH